MEIDIDGAAQPLLVADPATPTGARCPAPSRGSSGGGGLGGSSGESSGSSGGGVNCVFLDVPQRAQHGPTCGLHALAMVLHFWRRSPSCGAQHGAQYGAQRGAQRGAQYDAEQKCPTPPVGDEASGSPLAGALLAALPSEAPSSAFRGGNSLSLEDATADDATVTVDAAGDAAPGSPQPGRAPPGSLLALARSRGYSALGEMFNATQLGCVACAAGYRAALHPLTLANLRALLARGRPALVAFDAGPDGEPARAGGERAHYAVACGLATSSAGEPLVLARHAWNQRALHAWPWASLERSSRQLHGTSFYGGRASGSVPASVFTAGAAGIPLPARMRLGAVLGRPGVTDTSASLAGWLIEVVPVELEPLGTAEVWDEGAAAKATLGF